MEITINGLEKDQDNGAGSPKTVASVLAAMRQYAPLVNDTDMLWNLISSISLSDGSDETAIGLMEQHLAEAKGLTLSTRVRETSAKLHNE